MKNVIFIYKTDVNQFFKSFYTLFLLNKLNSNETDIIKIIIKHTT